MALDKPSDKESEYFAKLEAEKRKKLREELNKKREEEKKKTQKPASWMKCPKCGGDLEEKMRDDVAIDECSSCGGIWLDKGELELLIKCEEDSDSGFFAKLFSKK